MNFQPKLRDIYILFQCLLRFRRDISPVAVMSPPLYFSVSYVLLCSYFSCIIFLNNHYRALKSRRRSDVPVKTEETRFMTVRPDVVWVNSQPQTRSPETSFVSSSYTSSGYSSDDRDSWMSVQSDMSGAERYTRIDQSDYNTMMLDSNSGDSSRVRCIYCEEIWKTMNTVQESAPKALAVVSSFRNQSAHDVSST